MAGTPAVRLATPADAAALAELRHEFRSALNTPNESPDAFLARCTAWMRDRLATRSWLCWVAETPTELVGTVWLHEIEKIPNPVDEPESHGYITSCYVRPEHRGAGIGRRLIAAALAECDRRGVHSTILWPTPPSRSLYAREGFGAPATLLERPGARG